MLNSNERMGFIIEYMSSYDEKIKMANKNGLFDAAKMFELFAIEVCNVWFGQKFSNLNDETTKEPWGKTFVDAQHVVHDEDLSVYMKLLSHLRQVK